MPPFDARSPAVVTRTAPPPAIKFIDSVEFRSESARAILTLSPPLFQELSPGESPVAAGQSALAHPLLSPQGERHLFQRMNYCKFLAARLQAHLHPRQPSQRKLAEIRRLLQLAAVARDQLAQSNQRLVASLAHRFSRNSHDVEDFISEGSLILLKAIDKFDYTRGFRFSTYATHAVQRHFVRLVHRQQKQRARELCSDAVVERAAPVSRVSEPMLDPRVADQLIQRFNDCLDQREKLILEDRFGLSTATPAASETLKDIAEKVGLSKERVRQLQLRAIGKLQDLAARMNLRPEFCSG